jgi:hypothetical protein
VNDETDNVNILQPLELLASAISGRILRVAPGACGEAAWTDGRTVFLDISLSEREQLASLFVQSSLLSAGSLAPDILRRISRNSKLATRYLALEGHRALSTNQAVLPASIGTFFEPNPATSCNSPHAALARALGREPIADPPPTFGVIRAGRLLAVGVDGTPNLESYARRHKPRRQPDALAELDAEDDEDDGYDSGAAVEQFSIGGGAGFIGRWLQKLLKAGRQGGAAGSPGGDAGTHRSRSNGRRSGRSAVSLATPGDLEDVVKQDVGQKYPEWDMHSKRYRPDWCTVQETAPSCKEEVRPQLLETSVLRRRLARIALDLDHCRRQSQGDGIDFDAAIEARVQVMTGSTPDENVYVDSLRRRRDLSVLVLLDISGSAAEPGAQGQTIHEQQRAAAAALASALHSLGDRVALYAYNSQGRSRVQLMPVKRFDAPFNSLTMLRLYSLTPSAYSRLGAAIRHGAAVLEKEGGTLRRLLLVLSDGLAYDHGYEKDYGAADARRALSEARRRGTGCLCLTFGANADADSLRRVFGSAAHATIFKPSQLGDAIGALFHAALRSAEIRRRLA